MRVEIESLDSGYVLTRTVAHEQTRHAFEGWEQAWKWIDEEMPFYNRFRVIIEEIEEEEDAD